VRLPAGCRCRAIPPSLDSWPYPAKCGHSANQLDYPKADIPDWSCDDVICVCGATMPGS
jgi:hypothetical protein